MARLPLHRRLLATLLLASGLASADIAAPDLGAAPMPLEGDHIGTIYFRVGDIFDTTKPGENKALYRLAKA